VVILLLIIIYKYWDIYWDLYLQKWWYNNGIYIYIINVGYIISLSTNIGIQKYTIMVVILLLIIKCWIHNIYNIIIYISWYKWYAFNIIFLIYIYIMVYIWIFWILWILLDTHIFMIWCLSFMMHILWYIMI
jgi:hypothetical protein